MKPYPIIPKENNIIGGRKFTGTTTFKQSYMHENNCSEIKGKGLKKQTKTLREINSTIRNQQRNGTLSNVHMNYRFEGDSVQNLFNRTMLMSRSKSRANRNSSMIVPTETLCVMRPKEKPAMKSHNNY